jgi:hypothetical protein
MFNNEYVDLKVLSTLLFQRSIAERVGRVLVELYQLLRLKSVKIVGSLCVTNLYTGKGTSGVLVAS